ncbi:MAG: putative signal transduction protein containing Nacht domain [Chthonomonadaceae bacterium]|nr:putative signal transduction protein containing Nacht domain [Chthonomonadaceae bacterium]
MRLLETNSLQVARQIALLKHEKPSVRSSAADALGSLGVDPPGHAPAIPALIEMLKDENSDVRKSSAKALAYIGDASAVPALIEALKDENAGVWYNADLALEKLGVASVPALLEAQKDENSEFREYAARTLWKIRGASALPTLIEALRDENSNVRSTAARALHYIGDASALPALIKAQQDEDKNVRRSAVYALLHIKAASVKCVALMEVLKDLIEELKDDSIDGTHATHRLQGLLDSDDAEVFPALIKAFREANNLVFLSPTKRFDAIGPHSPVEALIDSLTPGYSPGLRRSNVRERAAEVLVTVGVAAVPALVRLQKRWQPDSNARAAAAQILLEIGDSITLPRKILASSQFSAQERIYILETLRRVRTYKFDDTRSLCQTVLNEEDELARQGAKTILHWLNGESDLLRASRRDLTSEPQQLLVAYEGGTAETRPETLVLPSNESKKDISPRPQQPSLWKRWFGKRK